MGVAPRVAWAGLLVEVAPEVELEAGTADLAATAATAAGWATEEGLVVAKAVAD